jgi:hypothetical protein
MRQLDPQPHVKDVVAIISPDLFELFGSKYCCLRPARGRYIGGLMIISHFNESGTFRVMIQDANAYPTSNG